MKCLAAYWRSVQRYWQTPKGHHDIVDYARAIVIIIGVMIAAVLLVRVICQGLAG